MIPFRIFHPSDFSTDSEPAFGHALRIAVATRAQLRMLHVAPSGEHRPRVEFPGVRATLERWGLLRPGARPEDVATLGVHVTQVVEAHADPATAVTDHLRRHPADLLVLATHQRQGLQRWLHDAVAEPVARRVGGAALFVPPSVEGFVSLASGGVRLRRLVIPVARVPPPDPAVTGAVDLLGVLGVSRATLVLVHAGDVMPAVKRPERPGLRWVEHVRRGDPVHVIGAAADEAGADLIVMTTEGHQGVADAIRGSTVERVLRASRCPVLAVPVGSRSLSRLLPPAPPGG